MTEDMPKDEIVPTYKVGQIVGENGHYVCVPCGYKRYYKVNERFTGCLKCLGKDWRLFKKGLELWERINEDK